MMLFEIEMDTGAMKGGTQIIDGISMAVRSNVHINDLIKNANALITGEFVVHMSSKAISEPKKFTHMYEWGGLGDPNSRLWRHMLRGRGSNRQLTFEFKASKKAAPVNPRLAELGVKKIHVFVWKAPVLELGQPVHIYPKLAKTLVFEHNDRIVFWKGSIHIPRQGNTDTWGSFTKEFNGWFMSGAPNAVLNATMIPVFKKTVRGVVAQNVRKLTTKNKKFTLTPVGIDKSVAIQLEDSLRASYITGAATRKVMVANDDV